MTHPKYSCHDLKMLIISCLLACCTLLAAGCSGSVSSSDGGASPSDGGAPSGGEPADQPPQPVVFPASGVSFAKDIQAIFSTYCISCHSAGGIGGFMPLTLGSSYANLVNVPAVKALDPGTRVIPGDSADSALYKRVSGIGLADPSLRMPQGGPYLDTLNPSAIAAIKGWIDEGAQIAAGVPAAPPPPQARAFPASGVSFANDVQEIFTTYCCSCHSAGSLGGFLPLTTLEASYANLVNVPAVLPLLPGDRVIPGDSANSVLYKRVSGIGLPDQNLRMPQGGPYLDTLNPSALVALKSWIDEGASSDGGSNNSPPQPVFPATGVSFANHIQVIFSTYCISCHQPGGSGGFMPLTLGASYANLVNVPAVRPLLPGTRVIPGDSVDSVLYKRVSGIGLPDPSLRMPLGGPFLDTLNPSAVPAIKGWIDEGALNN